MPRRPAPDPTDLPELTDDELAADDWQRGPLIDRSAKISLSARFDPDDVARLRAVAERQGVGATQLVRQWVLDRLVLEEASSDESVADVASRLDQVVASVEEIQRRLQAAVSAQLLPRGARGAKVMTGVSGSSKSTLLEYLTNLLDSAYAVVAAEPDVAAEVEPDKVVDLMAALERSVAEAKAARKTANGGRIATPARKGRGVRRGA